MSYLNSSAPALSQVETGLPAAPVPQPRLVKAAHEFEAAMMKELMAPMVPGHDVL